MDVLFIVVFRSRAVLVDGMTSVKVCYPTSNAGAVSRVIVSTRPVSGEFASVRVEASLVCYVGIGLIVYRGGTSIFACGLPYLAYFLVSSNMASSFAAGRYRVLACVMNVLWVGDSLGFRVGTGRFCTTDREIL